MSLEEYESFYPMADELIHYFEELSEDNSYKPSSSEIDALVSFGARFEVSS